MNLDLIAKEAPDAPDQQEKPPRARRRAGKSKPGISMLAQGEPMIWLSGGALVWILVAVVALALRLAHLDSAPLNGSEAREAMLAWRAVTGRGTPGTGYSPLLFAANALLFALCGAMIFSPSKISSALPHCKAYQSLLPLFTSLL